jgi:hypothetical protein
MKVARKKIGKFSEATVKTMEVDSVSRAAIAANAVATARPSDDLSRRAVKKTGGDHSRCGVRLAIYKFGPRMAFSDRGNGEDLDVPAQQQRVGISRSGIRENSDQGTRRQGGILANSATCSPYSATAFATRSRIADVPHVRLFQNASNSSAP